MSFKHIILVRYFLVFLFSLNLFSQEVSIPTQFSFDGSLYKKLNENLNELSQPVVDFSESDACVVIGYLGRDNYKVKYKEWEGIVPVDNIEVTEEIMDLYYAYQEKQREKAIEVKENREQKILKIRGEDEETLKAIRKQFVKDSISKRVAEQKAIREQFVSDSISRYLARQKVLREQFVKDSIANSLAQQKALRAEFVSDSILKSIAKQKAVKDKLAKDSKAKSAIVLMELREQFIKDSITASFKENQLKRERFIRDSIVKSLTNNKLDNDSIGKSVEAISIEFRNTCHYAINEFDPFYNVKTIRTDAYTVADNLTVELYKQGRKTNIFLNAKENLGCVSYFSHNRSSIRVTLENNQVVSFYHSWDMECGEFLFKGNLSNSQISTLKYSPIKSIRLKGTKGSVEISNIEYREFFMDKLRCIEE